MKKYYGSWAILAGLWITACTEPNQPKEMVPSVKLEQVKDAGGFLVSILPILFVSPAVGILENWGLIKDVMISMIVVALTSTIITFAVAGRVTQSLRNKEEKEDA